jgi:hypothetical protein
MINDGILKLTLCRQNKGKSRVANRHEAQKNLARSARLVDIRLYDLVCYINHASWNNYFQYRIHDTTFVFDYILITHTVRHRGKIALRTRIKTKKSQLAPLARLHDCIGKKKILVTIQYSTH